jgi:hypothetical protein
MPLYELAESIPVTCDMLGEEFLVRNRIGLPTAHERHFHQLTALSEMRSGGLTGGH